MKMPCRQLHDVQVGPMRGRQPVSSASARALVSTVTQHRLWRSGEWTWFGLVAKRTRRSSLLRSLYESASTTAVHKVRTSDRYNTSAAPVRP